MLEFSLLTIVSTISILCVLISSMIIHSNTFTAVKAVHMLLKELTYSSFGLKRIPTNISLQVRVVQSLIVEI